MPNRILAEATASISELKKNPIGPVAAGMAAFFTPIRLGMPHDDQLMFLHGLTYKTNSLITYYHPYGAEHG